MAVNALGAVMDHLHREVRLGGPPVREAPRELLDILSHGELSSFDVHRLLSDRSWREGEHAEAFARMVEAVRQAEHGIERDDAILAMAAMDATINALTTRATLAGHLRAGRHADAAAMLRDAPASGPAKLLLAVLDDDVETLIAGAHALLTEHGPRWPEHAVTGEEPLLAATAQYAPELFLALVERLPAGHALPGWAAEFAACRLLGRAEVELRHGARDRASESVARARALLGAAGER